MLKTQYPNKIASPFQMKNLKKDPLQEEIAKNIGTFNLTAIIEEDKSTLASFKHIPGFIAYMCTLKKGSEVIGVGRGSAILNRMNKFVDRTIRSAFCGSLIDAIVRSVKTLDALYLQTNDQKHPGVLNEENEIDYTPELASERQKSYLRQLVHMNIANERERDQWESDIDELTKEEASEKIQYFMR